ncbi:MAG: hypothetical protein U1A78_17670 [Polyangia bacterium]
MGLMLFGCGTPEETGDVFSQQQNEIIKTCPLDKATGKAAKDNIAFDSELFINSALVVTDPCRSRWHKTPPAGCDAGANGHWSFRYLMQQIAGENGKTEKGLTDFVMYWLSSYWKQPVVNGYTLSKRTEIQKVVSSWREASGCTRNPDDTSCTLDFEQAPFVLLSVVNRSDLHTQGTGGYGGDGPVAGELRFIFALAGFSPAPLRTPPLEVDRSKREEGEIIAEFGIPTDRDDAVGWARRFHALTPMGLGSAAYRDALQKLTDDVLATGPQLRTPRANGSTLRRLRTGEHVGMVSEMEFREFALDCPPADAACLALRNTMRLQPIAPTQQPHEKYNGVAAMPAVLQDYLTKSYQQILTEQHTVPATYRFGGKTENFQAGAGVSEYGVNSILWNAGALPAIPTVQERADTRRLFALSTCTGCHLRETKPADMMAGTLDGFFVKPSGKLAPFLLNRISVSDPMTFKTVDYDEPLRRQCEMQSILNGQTNSLSNPSGRPH